MKPVMVLVLMAIFPALGCAQANVPPGLTGVADHPAYRDQFVETLFPIDVSQVEVPLIELPPQELTAGECGAFFWDRAAPFDFRLFENETLGLVRYWTGEAMVEIPTRPRPHDYGVGDEINRLYASPPGDLTIALRGEVTEIRNGDVIIGRAALRQRIEDGNEIISPVVGLISCR